MSINSGFDEMQSTINVDRDDLTKARRRRDLLKARRRRDLLKALESADDVNKVRPSGSLARGTHKDPINDVDMVVEFDADQHADWGLPGASAESALEHVRSMVKKQLGTEGTGDVRHTRIQNHSIKCFLDDPDDPSAFTVDVTPALPRDLGGLWIPETKSAAWIASDPQYLIDVVGKRHADWNEFARLVRVLKRWNSDHGGHMKSLVVEVLALDHLPVDSRAAAVASFFAAAQEAVWLSVDDPAGLCGEIQPDMDQSAASAVLAEAADLAARAVEAAARDEKRSAQCLWRKVFGSVYPEPIGGCGSGASAAAATAFATPKRRVVDSPQG
jgi:predicted nucleotidyltransferase